jgi:CheY-like chemotaxis protein
LVGKIFGSGQHLLALINDILDLSKVEAGKMTLDLEPVSLAPMFVNSLSIVREKAAARRIHLDLDLGGAEKLGTTQADPRKVKQILYNLLSNAMKFTPEGGRVILRASHVSRAGVGQASGSWTSRQFPLMDSAFAEFLEIRVTDSGIGVPAAALDQLFRPFSQIDSGLARKFEGTGLGLAMVKLLAELHGGSVAVESAVGEGSCFTVWLPLRSPDAGPVASAAASAATSVEAHAGTRTALIVEDDEKSAELVRVQLEAEGFTVLHAATAEAALALAVQQPLVLITHLGGERSRQGQYVPLFRPFRGGARVGCDDGCSWHDRLAGLAGSRRRRQCHESTPARRDVDRMGHGPHPGDWRARRARRTSRGAAIRTALRTGAHRLSDA